MVPLYDEVQQSSLRNILTDPGTAMQMNLLDSARKDCEANDSSAVFDSGGILSCPQTWDGLVCWRATPAGTVARTKCPSYVFGFDTSEMATKKCLENGTWFFNQTMNRTWTNYTLCAPDQYIPSENISIFEPHLTTIKLISKIGYSVSLGTLVAAFVILASIKRLRCPRNSLHMHLFMSFILRALAFLLKDALFIEGVGLSGNVDFNKENVDCKVFTSFWHYVLMANYCWILMEGLYLHSLVFLAFFTDSSSILRYVALGWGLPVLFIVPWVVVRATLDDTLCWTTNPRQDLFWIIRGPITASIVVNFILFLNITRVLFAKLFASQTPQARKYRYRKWFKSTLVLVPLFGAHYAFLLGMSLAAAGDLLELVWLYIDQLFSSFQGFVVALLYCFLNGEVQTELRKLIERWRCDRQGPGRSDKQLQHRHSLFTQSVTFLSRGRSSIQSLHSVDKRETKSPSPNSAMQARSSQRLLSNADQLDTAGRVEEYQDSPRDVGGHEDRTTPVSQRNGDIAARWDSPEPVDTSKDNLLEKETCL
ncbi:secretin receptor-like isoform X6 [Dermacentor variabilis]|uniref:secretin receptor-like isoform X6 n=1 Tax=Dermacentor variabilis TaxID=34621 RepID=UPI003F5BDAD4